MTYAVSLSARVFFLCTLMGWTRPKFVRNQGLPLRLLGSLSVGEQCAARPQRGDLNTPESSNPVQKPANRPCHWTQRPDSPAAHHKSRQIALTMLRYSLMTRAQYKPCEALPCCFRLPTAPRLEKSGSCCLLAYIQKKSRTGQASCPTNREDADSWLRRLGHNCEELLIVNIVNWHMNHPAIGDRRDTRVERS